MSMRKRYQTVLFTTFCISCMLTIVSGCLANVSSSKTESPYGQTSSNSYVSPTWTAEITNTQQTRLSITPTFIEPMIQNTPLATMPSLDISPYLDWKIAFAMTEEMNNGIFVLSSGEPAVQNITEKFNKRVSFQSPSWSPDGQQIAYYWGSAGTNDVHIRIAESDGSGDHELTNGYDPAWSPDGKEIAFVRDQDLFTVDLGTQKVTKLTETKDSHRGFPVWSPDGKWIAYLTSKDASFSNADLFLMNSDGSGSHLINDMDVIPGLSRISWSPDGKEIAFGSSEDCGNICVVDIETGKTKCLTNTLANHKDPTWSPDGEWIVFAATQPTQVCVGTYGEPLALPWRLYIMNSDGSNIQPLINSYPDAWIMQPEWSPVTPLQTGKTFVITPLGEELRLRESPSLESRVLKQLKVGDRIIALEGPSTDGEYRWWKIKEMDTGLIGWSVEQPGWYRLTQTISSGN
ncbi:MAG: DPP IV N-terminal domain-containing protein [Chloroflexi bacterium]|nr:DPP IV N-terminal domain-containing protein [Chloroflexota bacterium]